MVSPTTPTINVAAVNYGRGRCRYTSHEYEAGPTFAHVVATRENGKMVFGTDCSLAELREILATWTAKGFTPRTSVDAPCLPCGSVTLMPHGSVNVWGGDCEHHTLQARPLTLEQIKDLGLEGMFLTKPTLSA